MSHIDLVLSHSAWSGSIPAPTSNESAPKRFRPTPIESEEEKTFRPNLLEKEKFLLPRKAKAQRDKEVDDGE